MRHEMMYEEFKVPTKATYITGLPFGEGKIGIEHALASREEYDEFSQALGVCTVPITKPNTADCVDERETIALGDGTDDVALLEARIVDQLPGGLVLALTKAAVGADLAILRDAKNFKDAYLKMYQVAIALKYEDGGHGDCGASKKVEESVFHDVSDEALMQALPLLAPVHNGTSQLLSLNRRTKLQRLESGFYAGWSNTWHEGFLMDKVPQNFSILAVDPNDHDTNGHHGAGIYALKTPGFGFAKNKFIRMTGRESFATTVATADKLTQDVVMQIGGSDEERARLRLEFGIDAPQVLDRLVVKEMPVFSDMV